jgi:hypothetical protein
MPGHAERSVLDPSSWGGYRYEPLFTADEFRQATFKETEKEGLVPRKELPTLHFRDGAKIVALEPTH